MPPQSIAHLPTKSTGQIVWGHGRNIQSHNGSEHPLHNRWLSVEERDSTLASLVLYIAMQFSMPRLEGGLNVPCKSSNAEPRSMLSLDTQKQANFDFHNLKIIRRAAKVLSHACITRPLDCFAISIWICNVGLMKWSTYPVCILYLVWEGIITRACTSVSLMKKSTMVHRFDKSFLQLFTWWN